MSSRLLSHVRPLPLSEFLFGAPYYPEHWEKKLRQSDPEWMAEAGFNCVRMGEFAWDLFEPEEGVFDFGIHTTTIDKLGKYGIRTIFCTPTATPPVWLTNRYPEVLRIDADGRAMQHGSRQHASHASLAYREHSRRITKALAMHFRDNPHVIGWQTDNEIHCHFSEDHSAAAKEAFQTFLKDKFRNDISELNRAWGTAFWSQTYRNFDEIPPPKPARPTWMNPSHVLDYKRFLSTAATLFQKDQVEILRETNRSWFITHNGCFPNIEYRGDFTRDLDFLGFDVYPSFDLNPLKRRFSQAYQMDHVRAYSGNVFVLEQQSGPGGQGDYFHDNPEPGEMRRMAWSSIARGADSLLLFRERSCPFGAEEYWCGILDHDNVPRRRFAEAKQLGGELKRVGPELMGTSVLVEVAVASGDLSVDAAHGAMSLGLPSPRETAALVHGFFYGKGYATGCIHPTDDLTKVSCYLLPNLALFDPAWLPFLDRYVRKGGVVVIGARTGSKDVNNNVVQQTLPGVLREFAGVEVEEYSRQNCSEARPLYLQLGKKKVLSNLWYEKLKPSSGTRVIGSWANRFLKGTPAVSVRPLGKGAVVYVGTYFSETLLEALLPFLKKAGEGRWPAVLPGWQDGIEVVCRYAESNKLWFYINHKDTAVALKDTIQGTDALTGNEVGGRLLLSAHGVAIVKEALTKGARTDRRKSRL